MKEKEGREETQLNPPTAMCLVEDFYLRFLLSNSPKIFFYFSVTLFLSEKLGEIRIQTSGFVIVCIYCMGYSRMLGT